MRSGRDVGNNGAKEQAETKEIPGVPKEDEHSRW